MSKPERGLPARPEVYDLLEGYRQAFALAADRRARKGSGTDESRFSMGSWLFDLEVDRYLADHMRRSTARLVRAYELRLAIADDARDAEDLKSLEHFAASLPAPRSRLWILLPLLVALAITQIAVTATGHAGNTAAMQNLVGLLDIKPAEIAKSMDGLLHTSVRAVIAVMIVGGVALWLVFAVPIRAFRMKRVILNQPDAFDREGRRQSDAFDRERKLKPLARAARETDVRGREENLHKALAIGHPTESVLDLWVSACAAAACFLVGVGLILARVTGRDERDSNLWVGILIVAIVAWRFSYLKRRASRRTGAASR